MAVVEGNPDAIQAQSRKELCIRLCEEVLEPSVEEEFVSFRTEGFSHCGAMLGLVAGVAGDEVLHAVTNKL